MTLWSSMLQFHIGTGFNYILEDALHYRNFNSNNVLTPAMASMDCQAPNEVVHSGRSSAVTQVGTHDAQSISVHDIIVDNIQYDTNLIF